MNTVTEKLTELQQELRALTVSNRNINAVAAKLDINAGTVRQYLKGNVAKESRGQLILKSFKALLKTA